jgi:hypothetical protein
VLVIQIDEPAAAGPAPGQDSPDKAMARVAAEFLKTGKVDTSVIQTLVASGKIPAGLIMKVLAAKNNPEKLKEIAKGLAEAHTEARAETQDGPAPGLSFVKPVVAPGEPLKLEILSFLESVRTRREPRVTARQGRAALELALTIQAQMAAHAERAGLGDFFKGSSY